MKHYAQLTQTNMKKIDVNKISTSENLRLYVLEFTLAIEELISETIGTILDINWVNSKSFGFSSSSLSFNQKVFIIQDFKDITSDEFKKFTFLMNIRNKFAHVRFIETYYDFYTNSGNGKEIKNALEKWYSSKVTQDIGQEEDDIFKVYFKLLCEDLISKLWGIILRTKLEKVNKSTNDYINNVQYLELKKVIDNLPNGKEIIEKLEEKMGRKF